MKTQGKSIRLSRRGRALTLLLLIPVLACLFPAFSFLSSSAHAQLPGNLQHRFTKEHPLIYVDAWDLWPYVFLDDDGDPTGYNVDMLKLIFDELNIPYEIHLKPTPLALQDLRTGRADLMLGMVASFHDPYTTYYGRNTIHLFTHSIAHPKQEPTTAKRVDDLVEGQFIVHEGSFSHHLMEDRGWGDHAIPHGDMDKSIQLISAEGRGQVLWNTMSLKWLIHKYHTDNLTLSPIDMPSGDYRFMANDKQLLRIIDDTYLQLKADNKLRPLEQKWFYPEEYEMPTDMPSWLKNLLIGIGFVAFVLTLASLLYRLRERNVTKEIRRRNATLALILQSCKVKVWTYDVKKKMFTWYENNIQNKRIYSTQEFGRRYEPDDFKRLMKAIEQVTAKKETDLRLEMEAKDGDRDEKRMYRVHISVLRSEKGEPTIIIGTKNDISEEYEQLQTDKRLMRHYQSVFDTAMVDMIYYDNKGFITDMNERAQDTFKMKLEDVLKEHVNLSDILPKENFSIDDFSKTDYFYATLFLDYASEKHLESRKRTGTLDYELQLVPVFDHEHQMLGVYGTGREVTELVDNFHKAQNNLEQLRIGMQEVTNYVDNINYAMKVGGVQMVKYSPETHMLTIYRRMHEPQYVLTQQRCLNLLDKVSVRQVMRSFRAMDRMTNKVQNCDIRTRLRLPGDKFLCIQIQLFPTLDENGVVTLYSGICRDTTEMKHTEQLLLLESEKAQEIEQVKNKFLHNMCYEIRTPLNTVVSFAEQFEHTESAEQEEHLIDEIKKNSNYLLNLINDILFLSRLDARMVEIKTQPMDFTQTFEAHCHMGWGNKKKEGVNYVVENNYEKLVVMIDDANVGRVIQQVAENAACYTSQGSVRARYEYIGDKLMITIIDTGSGIEASKLEHIFERFNTSQANYQGTGLGLPICKEIVTQLGGTINISSEVGKGTNVWITIPCEALEVELKKQR
ncbi:MAG: transporter substrate-binding domain-containing protein [Prevotella sp.]|nr:transporter substrate-binding domain-containing protein [Prevotella sp.]